MGIDAVIVAAGSSTRFGAGDKLWVELYAQPVLAWSLAAFEAAASIERVLVVCAEGMEAKVAELARLVAPGKFAGAIAGGARRRDSVEAGLRASRSRSVAIHDGARPLVMAAAIDAVVAAAEGKAGAILAAPVTDTIKEMSAGVIVGHPERSRLWAAQTPQVVLRQAWLDAAAASDGDETDDAAMLSRLGLECAVVAGDPGNIKITQPLDLELARLILAERMTA